MESNKLAHLENDIKNITQAELLTQDIWREWLILLSDIYRATYDGARAYFYQNKYTEIFPTILGGALGACENFQTVYDFGEKLPERFLSQTAQIQLETCLIVSPAAACITRSFRRETNIHDGRHLREFTLVEIEKSQCNLDQILEIIEQLVKAIVVSIDNQNRPSLQTFLDFDLDKKIKPYVSQHFQRLTYTEAIEILKKQGKNISWGDDLSHIDEQTILKYMDNRPFFLTHFPKAIKFFNMKQNDENPEIVNSVDFILPRSGEALGGSERETKYDVILNRFQNSEAYQIMRDRGLTQQDFGCYFANLKDFEIQPHAGFGLGLERLLQSLFTNEPMDIRVFSLPFILMQWLIDRKKI